MAGTVNPICAALARLSLGERSCTSCRQFVSIDSLPSGLPLHSRLPRCSERLQGVCPVLPWILLPLLVQRLVLRTNWLAITMLFRPRVKRWEYRGFCRRQADLAKKIGQVVARDLVHLPELVGGLKQANLRPSLKDLLDRVIAAKMGDLQKIPLIGGLLKPDLVNGLRDSVLDELDKHQGEIIDKLINVAEDHVDIAEIVERKMAEMDFDGLENVIRGVASNELRAIEWWGAVLGALIGLAQATLLAIPS